MAQSPTAVSRIGLCGLAVMGQARNGSRDERLRAAAAELTALAPCVCVPLPPQNLALNVAEKGFTISVFNRSSAKTDEAVKRAAKEGAQPL